METVKIPIEEFKRKYLSEDDANQLLDFFEDLSYESDPEYRPSPREQRLKNMRKPNPHVDNYEYLIRKDDSIIAVGGVGYMNEDHPGYLENKNIMFVDVKVLSKYRQEGLARAIIEKMIPRIREIDRPVLIANSDHEAGKKVAFHYGGKSALEGAENRLYLDEVDWQMLETWIEEGMQQTEDVNLLEFNSVPKEIAEEYLAVYSETMNQQPLGDIEFEHKETLESRRIQEERLADLGVIWTTLITKESDGSISGLTELFYNPSSPHRAGQNLTGVRQKYRGRGLGKWLKAEMLCRFKDRYPDLEYIATGNADVNAPMLSINKRLGFKRFKSNIHFKFDTEEFIKQFSRQ